MSLNFIKSTKLQKSKRELILLLILVLAMINIVAGTSDSRSFLRARLFKNPEVKAEDDIRDINILNPHSSPQAGDDWTVSFETTGTADLTITPDDQASIDDLDFVSLRCGEEERTPLGLENDVIFYPNWSCQEQSEVTHLVNVAGDHTLKFQFGDQIAYAYNSDTLYERYIIDDSGATNVHSTYWRAQTFTLGNTGTNTSHDITSVKLLMYKTGNPGTLTVTIRAVDGSNHPLLPDLCTGTTNANDFTTDTAGLWYEIIFGSPVSLSSSTQYAIVLKAPDGDVDNRVKVRVNNISGDGYTGGADEFSQDSGVDDAWHTQDSDNLFEEYGLALNETPTALASNIDGEDDPVYAGVEYELTAVYSDADGYDDLDEMYLKIDHNTGTDIEFHADEGGPTGSGSATVDGGGDYLTSATYSYTSSGDDITMTWTFELDWDWDESELIEYAVRAVDDQAADSGYDATTIDVKYEKDLDFTGALTASGGVQGSLSDEDWIQGSEEITWSGLEVVYEGSAVNPDDADFDVRVSDDDGGTWDDTTSSGEDFSIVETVDAATDTEDIHTIEIIGIPTDGDDVSSEAWTVKVDADDPTTSLEEARPDAYDESSEYDDDTEIYFTWSDADGSGSGVVSCNAEIGDDTPDEDADHDGEDTDDGSEGSNTYYVQCTDGVGNTSSVGLDTITIDETNPEITDISIASDNATYFYESDTNMSGDNDQIFFNSLNGEGGTQSITITITTTETNPDQAAGQTAFSDTPTDEDDDTTQTLVYSIEDDAITFDDLTVTVTDQAGRTDTYDVDFTADNDNPTGTALSWGTVALDSIQVTPENASDGTGSGLTATPYYIELDQDAVIFSSADANSGWTSSVVWTPSSLKANEAQAFQVKSIDNVGNESSWVNPSPVYKYTLANTPNAPTVDNAKPTTIDVNPVTGGAESAMAIYAEEGASCDGADGLGYVQANGSISGSAIWQADGTWTTVTVTGLSEDTQHSFCVKARNGDETETGFGSAGSATTENTPTNDSLNLLSHADGDEIFAGKTYTWQVQVTDADGYADLTTVVLHLDPSPGDDETITWTQSGDSFSESSDYFADASSTSDCTGNTCTLDFKLTMDWDWENTDDTATDCQVVSTDDQSASDTDDYLTDTFQVENDLDLSGTLACSGSVQDSLASGDWVQASETLSWSGLTVVYQGSSTNPANADFNIRITDDDTGSWTQTTGANLNLNTTADATTDPSDIHQIDITSIPSGASDVSNKAWTVKVDADLPTNVGASTPTNNATDVSTDTALVALTATDTNSGLASSPYYIELATDSDFTENLQNSGWEADGSWKPTLSAKTTYYWRIKGRDVVGNESSLCGHTPDAAGYGTFTTFKPQISLTKSVKIGSPASVLGAAVSSFFAFPNWLLILALVFFIILFILISKRRRKSPPKNTNPPRGALNVPKVKTFTFIILFTLAFIGCLSIISLRNMRAFEDEGDTVNPGDTLTYKIAYQNTSDTDAEEVVIIDSIPSGSSYVSSSLNINGTSKTDALDKDEADFNQSNSKATTFNLGTIAKDTSGYVTFQVKVNDPKETETIENQGQVNFNPGEFTVFSNTVSNPVEEVEEEEEVPKDEEDKDVPKDEDEEDKETPKEEEEVETPPEEEKEEVPEEEEVSPEKEEEVLEEEEEVPSEEKEEEEIEKKEAPKEEPEEEVVTPPVKEKLELNDFLLEVEADLGLLEISSGELDRLRIIKGTPLAISIPADRFTKPVKEITITLGSQSFTLELNKETGKYEAIIAVPFEKGEYALTIDIIYQDGTKETISTEILVDPYGYVYEKRKMEGEFKEIRIPKAEITLFYFNSSENNWQKWDGTKFNQENPKITDQTGEYAFMVLEGRYYLEVIKQGYQTKKTDEFEVKELVNKNIEISPIIPFWQRFWWLWGVLGLAVVLGLGVWFLVRRKK